MNKKTRKKLIVIGIDGGNFEVINSLIKKGKIKNLQKLKNKSILKSTMPPGTAVSWASFSTGLITGKTNIYDFTIVQDNSWNIKIVNRKRLNGKPLWEYLSENKIKTCYFNIPLTYPAEKINGIMVSGIDAPNTMSNYVYPSEFKSVLKKLDYEIEVSGIKEKDQLVKTSINVLDKRIKAAKILLKKNFDFCVFLFRETDVAQHFAWGKKEVQTCYEKVDKFIGMVSDYAKKNNANILVMSDHGEESVTKAFNINNWLIKEGYLKTHIKNKNILSSIGVNREKIFKILSFLNLDFLIKIVPRKLAKKIPSKVVNFEEAIITGLIDMKKTKAIGKRAVKTAQIFFNTKKRGGIVPSSKINNLAIEIKDKLRIFFKNNNIKAQIYTKQEIYGGSAINAPDLIIYMKEGGMDISTEFTNGGKLFGQPKEKATHNTEGIIYSDLDLNLDNPRIIDLCPTILSYFGINGKFDGKSLL